MRALSLLALVLFTACGSRALSPGAPAPVALTASGTTDGVTLRLDLDRASVKVGEVVWATITIENTNDHAIRWVGGGCNVPGRVMANVPTLSDYGKSWDYPFAELKKRLGMVMAPGYIPWLDEEAWKLRAQGGRACTADIRINELAAHGRLTSRHAWDGVVDGVPVPSGDAKVTGSFEMDDIVQMVGRSVSASVTLTVTGGSATRVSPGQALDAAFSDTRFAAWVRARFVARGNSGPGAYDVEGSVRLDGDTWVIQAAQKTAPAGQIEVRVNALDGTVLSVVER